MVRLYSNGVDLDLGEFSTTLTFSIADIREPDKRNASFSKTLTLPGTKANNLFFENMFEVDVVTQTFNPNLKARTVLSVDGVTQFKGALKLRQVNYLLGGQVTYDCNLIGNLADLFQDLGNNRLRNLDLSAYDHIYNKANIVSSWSPTLGVGYAYPMINYGTHTNLQEWDVYDWKPGVFAKTILDKIFSEAGYTYSSNFLTSDLFKRLIIPSSEARLHIDGTTVNGRLINVGRTSTYTQALGTTDGATVQNIIPINNDSSGSYFDNDASFNTATYKHSPLYSSQMDYSLTFDGQVKVVKNATVASNNLTLEIYVDLIRDRNGTLTPIQGASGTYFWNAPNAAGTYYITTDQFGITQDNSFFAQMVDVNSGDDLYLRFTCVSSGSVGAEITSVEWEMSNIFFRNSFSFTGVLEGDTLVVSDNLPDILQKDFLMGIVKMFNLYLEPDKDDETLLNIEPRDTYYNSTQVDWSGKLATEKDLEIEPMALLNFKRLICQYKDDTDYYNKDYKQAYERNYGSYLANIENDFVSGEYKIEPIFAPTPLVGSYDNDRIIPAIFAATGNPPSIEIFGAQPRILYWKGLTNCEDWNFLTSSGSDFKTQYPYAGHLDDPQTPTIDLSFGIPQKVYYGVNQYISSLTYTDNNLYNIYYSQMISEITDRDSKLVTGYFWLTPVDILNLDFRKIYRVGSHALRLNKIYDYNPVKPNLTKCEFIKIKDTSTFVSNSEIMNGGIDIVINSRENAPVIDMGTFIDGNVVARPSSTVITGEKNYAGGGLSTWISGRNNRVHGRNSSGVVITGEDNIVQDGASGVVIHGYGNNVGFGAKSLFIQGDRNTINAGIENVTLLHTNSQTITTSDTLYINGVERFTDEPILRTTGWAYSNNKLLNSFPNAISELTAQANKIILVKELLFCLDAGGTPFNFANNIKLRYTGGFVAVDIDKAIINSATDYYFQAIDINAKVAVGEGLELYSAADAAAGNGTYYYKIIYQVIDKPF